MSLVDWSLTILNRILGEWRVVPVGPGLEIAGELVVGDDVHRADAVDRREVVEHPFDHRLARDIEQRLGFVEGERVEARGVTGGEDEDVHSLKSAAFGKFDVIEIDAISFPQSEKGGEGNQDANSPRHLGGRQG